MKQEEFEKVCELLRLKEGQNTMIKRIEWILEYNGADLFRELYQATERKERTEENKNHLCFSDEQITDGVLYERRDEIETLIKTILLDALDVAKEKETEYEKQIENINIIF